MTRQRVSLRLPAFAVLSRAVTVVFGLAIIYGGVMVVLLAAKVSPHTVNQISDYRTVYHDAAGLSNHDFTTKVSLIAGFGGLLLFLAFAFLCLQALPRPYLTRTELALDPDPAGRTTVRPRAVERVAEYAACEHPNIASASGRLDDGALELDVGLTRAAGAATTLADVRQRVAERMRHHELPPLPVNVVLTGYDATTRRDPS